MIVGKCFQTSDFRGTNEKLRVVEPTSNNSTDEGLSGNLFKDN